MWAGVNWRNGMLINGIRYQRGRRTWELDGNYNEDLYCGLS